MDLLQLNELGRYSFLFLTIFNEGAITALSTMTIVVVSQTYDCRVLYGVVSTLGGGKRDCHVFIPV